MTDGNNRKKAQAVFFSLVMVLSMVGGTVALAGSAAADVQDFDGLTAEDVTAGQDDVIQNVTLESVENNNNTDTIEITNDGLDGTIIDDGDTTIDNANGHDASVSVQSDGTIVVDLAADSQATADIELDVAHNLSDVSGGIDGVQYTATTNGITQTTTFDVSERQPSFNNGSVTVPEDAPDTLEVQFNESIENVGTDTEISNAFTLTNVNDSTGTGLSVTGSAGVSGDTITLNLNGFVGSDEPASNMQVSYDGSGHNDPIVHAGETDVTALPSTDEEVTSNAVPTLDTATVTDANNDRVQVTFSEDLTSASNSDIDSAFSLDDGRTGIDDVFQNTSDGSADTVILNLTSGVAPGDDLSGLSYDGSTNNNPLTATAGGANAYDFQDRTVSNNVVPTLQSAEVTAAQPGYIIATFEDGASVEGLNTNAFNATTLVPNIASISDDESFINANEVALELSSDIGASDNDLGDLQYASSDGTSVQSTAGVPADDSNVTINNNAGPTFVSAQVTNANPGQVEVTFSEAVQANVSDGNIDSAVTDAFELKNDTNGIDYRIKNVENGDGFGTTTLTLNLGPQDGTSQVQIGDDLTGALSYDPTAPNEANEKYPLQAAGGTNADVQSFSDRDVTNNIGADLSIAQVTATGDELRVTFTENVERDGTTSEVEDAFAVDSSVIDVNSSYSDIENGDTVVFSNTTGDGFVDEPGNYNSSLNLDGTLNYTATDGNDPLTISATGDAVGDFSDEDITNNIQPFITDATVSNANPGTLTVSYSEEVTSNGTVEGAFSLDGADAPDITDATVNTDTIDLTLGSDVAPNDSLGTLSYDAGTTYPVDSNETGSSATALSPDSFRVTESVGDNPTLLRAVVDDAPENTDDDAEGEMLLYFDQDVSVDGTDASGLSFESNNVDVGVSFNQLNSSEDDSPANVVIANYTSDSGSTSSNIRYGEDLSNAVLTVSDAEAVDINGTADDNSIVENEVTDISNEIAGDLNSVDTLSLDVEVVPTTDKGDDTQNLSVTVEGLEDADGNPIKTADVPNVSVVNASEDTLTELSITSIDRFDNTSVTVDDYDGTNGDLDSAVGEEISAQYAGSSTNTATVVHEAYSTDSSGYFLHSQPMPGTLVLGDQNKFGDINYYESSSGEYASYADGSDVDQVHNALFIESLDSGASYGYVYDESRDVSQINVGSIEMGEGWHIVGSNYDVSDGSTTISLNEDLSLQNDINGTSVSVQDKSLPGTTRSGDYTVDRNEAYYVFLQQEDTRPIVLPEYDPDE